MICCSIIILNNAYEVMLMCILIIMTVTLIKDRKGNKYNPNTIYGCISSLILFAIIDMFNGIVLFFVIFVVSIILKKIYDMGIDEINEYELKGNPFGDKDRRKLSDEYDLLHRGKELDELKAKAKRSKKYRMKTQSYFFTVYAAPGVLLALKCFLK